MTNDTKVPERKLRRRPQRGGADGFLLGAKLTPTAAITNIDRIAWSTKRSSHQHWPLKAQNTSPLQWWRTLPADEFRDAEQLLLLATLKRIRVLRGGDDLKAALGGDTGAAIDVAFTLMPIETFTLEGDIAMTALARCAIERNAAAALVLAQIIGLTDFDHGLGMVLAGSWYAHGRRYSSEPSKFGEAGAVLLAAILERRHDGGEA